MDIIESIKNNKDYLKFKLLVKKWEKEFKATNSRIPSKFDIKEAPANVRYAYKQYFHIKSSALENSLIDYDEAHDDSLSPEKITFSDSFFNGKNSPHSEEFIERFPTGEQLDKLLSTNCQKDKETVCSDIRKPLTPFIENLSKKLYENRKFTIRNPRKSLSFKLTPVVHETTLDVEQSNETLPYFKVTGAEKISPEKAALPLITQLPDNSANPLNYHTSKKYIQCVDKMASMRQINRKWLERATGCNYKDHGFSQDESDKFGVRNIIVANLNNDKLLDYVENSESENDDTPIVKLKPALKKKKVDLKDTVSLKIDKEISDTNKIVPQDKIAPKRRNKKIVKNKSESRMRKAKPLELESDIDVPPDIHEFVPMSIEENIIPRFTRNSQILKDMNGSAGRKDSVHPLQKITTARNKLEEKIKNGTINDNFVKINIEKKVFVRGKKGINYSRYKKRLWKSKKMFNELQEGNKITCFKCGETGHMSRFCNAHKGDSLLPLNSVQSDEIPTLDDMDKALNLNATSLVVSDEINIDTYTPTAVPETFLKLLAENPVNPDKDQTVNPIYLNLEDNMSDDMLQALHMFGHKEFRPGQEKAIMRVLCGMSTLLILSTGGGKSLCYQIPAYIYSKYYKCITLVISPLVSLMEDQVLSMPEFLKAGCLHTNQTPTHRKKIIQCLIDGMLSVLLISPEALISGDRFSGFGGLFKSLPPIAFACIDEAHCVSQWSHNFRPSYLTICRVLREKLNVKCILGLTATASKPTITSIIQHIHVPDGNSGVIINPSLPDNLLLSVSNEIDNDRALITLLSSEKFNTLSSIIVYCIRRDQCERIAAILRSSLREPGQQNIGKRGTKRKRSMSFIAEAYHAGMSAAQRKRIQTSFMDGSLKIIVATIAFGMGINKSDIRCIIHYNMPSTFESYVQEVGRAGRDGDQAHCHVFISQDDFDKNELLKHIHSNTIDRHIIRKLLQKIFVPCDCRKENQEKNKESIAIRCPGHEVAFSIDNTVEELDLASENIATLLCYLELHPKHYIKVLNNSFTKCKIISYGGPQSITNAAKNCPPLSMAFILQRKNMTNLQNNIFEFPVIDVAAAMGWESGIVKYQLKNLEWVIENGSSKKSQLKIEFNSLGFRIRAPGDLSPVELDNILDDIHNHVVQQEKSKLYQLEEIKKAFSYVARTGIHQIITNTDDLNEKSNILKETVRSYFERDNVIPSDIVLKERPIDEERAIADIRALINSYKDCTFTGRSIARILQGIASPNYPAIIWGRCKFWRSHIHEDFNGLTKLATQQIINMN